MRPHTPGRSVSPQPRAQPWGPGEWGGVPFQVSEGGGCKTRNARPMISGGCCQGLPSVLCFYRTSVAGRNPSFSSSQKRTLTRRWPDVLSGSYAQQVASGQHSRFRGWTPHRQALLEPRGPTCHPGDKGSTAPRSSAKLCAQSPHLQAGTALARGCFGASASLPIKRG